MKKLITISCPLSSRSGYGDHARDLVRSIISMDTYNVEILDQRWGNCPRTELIGKNEDLIPYLLPTNEIKTKPDIWIQITVPNEFQPIGKYNIGITAGMETTMVDPSWIEGCNRMNKVLVPSQHSKKVFDMTTYDKMDKQTNQKAGELRTTTPVEVLFEGLDLEVYKKTSEKESKIEKFMSNVKEDFCFLAVGHWLKGDIHHDRKDLGSLILNFNTTFNSIGSNKKPALILKTSGATYSVVDREEIRKKILSLIDKKDTNTPSIYFLHGDLSEKEMNALYNHQKIKSMVSFTHGEGFGRPLLEFSVTGKPTIAPNWSGQVDFLLEHGILLGGELKQVHQSAAWENVILKDSQWFYVNMPYASSALKTVFKKYKNIKEKSRKQTQYVKDNFSLDKMTDEFEVILKSASESISERVEFKLPKLEKI